jgi:hypothetical protein
MGGFQVYKIATIIIAILLTITPATACSSIIGTDNFGFQRDSTEQANITINQTPTYIIESKPGFTHSIIFTDGDAFGIGGADNNICNKIITKIGFLAHDTNIPQLIYLAAPFTWYTGGHLAYKDGSTVYYMTFVGGIKIGSKTLQPDEYFITSNDAISTTTYRASDVFTAINQSNFAAGHHRYAIQYTGQTFKIQNYQNDNIYIL